MSQRSPGHAPVSSIAPESLMPPCGIGPEPRIERDAEREQRRGAGAVPVGDEAARVGAGRRDRLGQFVGLQGRQIALEHNDVRRRAPGRAASAARDRGVQRVAVTVGCRVGEHLRAEAPCGVGRDVVGRDDGDRAARRAPPRPR